MEAITAKFTRLPPPGPDDPIFSGRAIVSVPVARPRGWSGGTGGVPPEVRDEVFKEMKESMPRRSGKRRPRLVEPERVREESKSPRRGIVTVDLEMMGMTLEEYYAIDDDSTDGKSK